ncbi:Panacea domain-containing protein [Methylopila turkensis]|uniref:Antitoxin SocA-like Panacea domain-containing protein n=1 Tax=Methylopila turkensis TaxID=1437816 RepID=A0A9W6N773_9HYPH|nr:type II toxin-antitoxin system antitoxin SocA domain-containing protein [Methylopila turkensis]GLK80066.1 hypothetical protein GCM10008174_18070 [Methylopila turkensis]
MASTAPYDARAVANFLLDLADSRGVALTQVTLLKLIYFAHGWYLAAHGKPLVSHDFEAWQYGPVLKVIRDAFKQFGPSPITSRANKLVLQTGEYIRVKSDLLNTDASFVTAIFEEYANFTPWQLSEMTHEPGSPWHRIWHTQEAVGRIALRIRNDDILAHFASIGHRMPIS